MKYLNKVLTVVFLMWVCVGVYHLSTIESLDMPSMKKLYHSAYNIIILTLLYFVFYLTKGIKKYVKHQKVIVILSIYPTIKVLINLLYMFNSFRLFISSYDIRIWSIILFFVVIASVIGIKYIRK